MTRRAAPTPRAQPKRDEMIKPIETPSLVKHYQDIQRSHLLHGRPGSSAVTPAALSTDGRGGMITGGTRAGSRGGLRAELTPGAATARRDKPRGFLGRPSQVLKAQAVSGGAPLSRLDKESRRGAFGLSNKEPSDGAARPRGHPALARGRGRWSTGRLAAVAALHRAALVPRPVKGDARHAVPLRCRPRQPDEF